jgi:hypothetical protein
MSAYFSNTNDTNDYARIFLSFVVFVSNLNAESIIDTWNVPAKTKKESNQKKEGMYNIFDFQLMGALSKHKNGGPGGSMS